MDSLLELREYVEQYGTAPIYGAMPRLTLEDKGVGGPTGAHRVEEIHTPLNFSYISVTTGTTAFQNIVGVTFAELDDRILASVNALKRCGLFNGDEMLVTYPPLVNVFPHQALSQMGIEWYFMKASSRDALILALCGWQAAGTLTNTPDVLAGNHSAPEKECNNSAASSANAKRALLGESSFIRATLESAKQMGLLDRIPRGLVLITAGTPLDMELLPIASSIGATVHDLYGCQEFGWLTLNGVPLREDISLLPADEDGNFDLVVGGLPTGDRFAVLDTGHALDADGKIITYSRQRATPELETTVLETTASSIETVERLARTIIRIKAKIIRVSDHCKVGAEKTLLSLAPYGRGDSHIIAGPVGTKMFDTLLEAQMSYQSKAKNDPAWNKER
ncbi:acyl carrier protein [Eubacteriales bacterium OttesenSCG-928-K08]|nr:acyl carrier protein [Eubacteriales bacterium OttesenSCG-928-K08]